MATFKISEFPDFSSHLLYQQMQAIH